MRTIKFWLLRLGVQLANTQKIDKTLKMAVKFQAKQKGAGDQRSPAP